MVGLAAGLWRSALRQPQRVAESESEPAAEPASDPDLCQSESQTSVRVGDLEENIHDALISMSPEHCPGRIEIAEGVICSGWMSTCTTCGTGRY